MATADRFIEYVVFIYIIPTFYFTKIVLMMVFLIFFSGYPLDLLPPQFTSGLYLPCMYMNIVENASKGKNYSICYTCQFSTLVPLL